MALPSADGRPCAHPRGRRFPDRIVREMLRALGVVTCDSCGEVLRMHGRRR